MSITKRYYESFTEALVVSAACGVTIMALLLAMDIVIHIFA